MGESRHDRGGVGERRLFGTQSGARTHARPALVGEVPTFGGDLEGVTGWHFATGADEQHTM